jgi:hypothetical protein
MGARAVLKIYSPDHDGAFWTAWGSPEFILSGLAHWIEACRWRNQMPSAENYWDHAQVAPGNQFTEAIAIDAPYPSDLNFRYELRATTALYGWGADLSVWSNVGGLGDRYALRHQLSVSNLMTAPIHAVAAAGMQTLVRRATTQGRSGCTAETVDFWAHQAQIHEAYSRVDNPVPFGPLTGAAR